MENILGKRVNPSSKGIIEYIKQTILLRYPIVENRMDALNNPNSGMDISIEFVKDGEYDITEVKFQDSSRRNPLLDFSLVAQGLLSIEEILNLIRYFLNDYGIIHNFDVSDNKIFLSFNMDLINANKQGVSSRKISICLDFNRYPDYKRLMYTYLKSIVEEFYDNLKYSVDLKTKSIDEIPYEELMSFISLLIEFSNREYSYLRLIKDIGQN